jgi:hypothetical protein
VKNNKLFKTCIAFILFLSVNGVFAMAMSDVGKVCLFSAISGVITLDGMPVTSARLVRIGDRDGAKTDETTTDENGYFEFPAMLERTITKFLPMEFVASQEIIVHYNNQEYSIWRAVKRNPAENTESRGKPFIVKCELSGEETHLRVNNSPIFTLCSWDVEPDPKINMELF